MGENIVQAKQWLETCCGDPVSSETTIKYWYADFKLGCRDIDNAECREHSNEAVTPKNVEKIYKFEIRMR